MYIKKSESREGQELLLEPPPPPPPKTTRRWSKLPLRFVKHLLRRLQIPDYIRFSSVCHAWHVSKKRAQTLPSQQLPWLLLPRNVDEPSITFYSLSEDFLYRIPIPCIVGSKCVSAIPGWLLTEPNFLANPATRSRLLLNPFFDIRHELPKNSLVPPVIIAAATVPSPFNPNGFWVFLAYRTSIFAWNPNERGMFKKDIDDSDADGMYIVDMTAEGGNLYFVTEGLELFEYDPISDATKLLIENPPIEVLPAPSEENDHFLMVAHVGDEMKILMAVVVYDLDVLNETVIGVNWVELFSPRGGEWVRVEAAEFGNPVLFLSCQASSFCVAATEAGGRGSRAYLVLDRMMAESLSKAREVEDLMWVEIDLVNCAVTYKECKRLVRTAKKPIIQSPPTSRPWSRLPLRFAKHLLCRLQLRDYVRFSSVCHAWHVTKKRAQTPPAPQLPWLILPRQPHESIMTYYSLLEDCTYRLGHPSISGYDCVASSHGWLLFEAVSIHSDRRFFVLNPLFGGPEFLPITDFGSPKISAGAILVPSTPTVWIIIASGNTILAWDLISSVQHKGQLNSNVEDMVAIGDSVCILMEKLELVAYDPQSQDAMDLVLHMPPEDDLPPPSMENDHFLVAAQAWEAWDILMAVVYYVVCDNKRIGVDRMELYVSRGEAWSKVLPEAIGDQVLFLGFGGSSVSVTAAEAGGKARTAYVVPKRERVKSLSNGVDRKWVEIDLVSGGITYK